MIKAEIITLDEEFKKARKKGAKDIKKRKSRGKMDLEQYSKLANAWMRSTGKAVKNFPLAKKYPNLHKDYVYHKMIWS